MKIGFFGGSFNPPTLAHTYLAKLAIYKIGLDKVIFVPIGDFYEKKELLPIDTRIKMIEIICNKESKFEVSDIEKNFKEKKYAIDIFKIIEDKFKKDDFYFLLGSDNFCKLPKWKNFEELKKYKYIVFERNEKIENKEVNGLSNVYFISTDITKNISSTAIRNSVKNKNRIKDSKSSINNNSYKILDDDVEKFIYDNKLYM